jgi:hypothetical protein
MSASIYRDPSQAKVPYKDPTPLPDDVPHVAELGVTSAPLKSAAFFLSGFCQDYNGVVPIQYDVKIKANKKRRGLHAVQG